MYLYLSEKFIHDRHQEMLDRAHEVSQAHRARELRRLRRMQHRADRRLAEAWRRAGEIREALDVAS